MPHASPDNFNSPAPSTPRVRLEYLDGLRGIAALYVVLHHALMEIDSHFDGAGLPRALVHATVWLLYGQIAVDIFIVLSGYCLMLPVVRSAHGLLRGGARDFFVRRARRILPPYFAALALCLLIIRFVPQFSHAASERWPGRHPHLAPLDLLSHVLLLHNWDNRWIFAIDYPLWSVASEWQIYGLFPLVLLPLWRRFGGLVPIAAGFALGIACFVWLPQINLACPWFVGLFALGMGAATVSFSRRGPALGLNVRLPWGVFAAVAALAAGVACRFYYPLYPRLNILADGLVGLTAACFLVSATRHLTYPAQFAAPWGLRACASRGAVWLGTFSYSLYLVHAPIVAMVHDVAGHFALPPAPMLLALFGVGVPLSIAAAYGFYRVFERPFLPGHPRTDGAAARAEVTSPAP